MSQNVPCFYCFRCTYDLGRHPNNACDKHDTSRTVHPGKIKLPHYNPLNPLPVKKVDLSEGMHFSKFFAFSKKSTFTYQGTATQLLLLKQFQ